MSEKWNLKSGKCSQTALSIENDRVTQSKVFFLRGALSSTTGWTGAREAGFLTFLEYRSRAQPSLTVRRGRDKQKEERKERIAGKYATQVSLPFHNPSLHRVLYLKDPSAGYKVILPARDETRRLGHCKRWIRQAFCSSSPSYGKRNPVR
jgi:hypothetical protein